MPPFERHIFICCNQREADHPRGSCNPDADDRLQKAFKKALAARGLNRRVRANRSGCLDQCEHGPTVVVYPDTVWYGFVTEADIDEIIDAHLIGGTPVARLRLADACVNTASCPHKPRPQASGPRLQASGSSQSPVTSPQASPEAPDSPKAPEAPEAH